MAEFISHHLVRFDDVDGAGIVYYPRYLHFCHKTFEDLFNQKAQIKYPQLIKQLKIGFPTVKIEANYFAPFFYGDEIQVHFKVLQINNSSLVTKYQFFNLDKLSFEAQITIVCMDLVTKKSLSLSEDLRNFFKIYL